jgi:magnesium transporter
MSKRTKRSKKTGLPPGTTVHIGERKAENAKITVIDYDNESFQEKEIDRIEESFPFKDRLTLTWINIDGIHDVELIEKLGDHFNLHPLLLEDIANTEQRPKIEDFDSYLFIILKMLSYDKGNDELNSEQISLILGSNFVISLQEREGDVFDHVRGRIRAKKGRIRKMGADYLAYSLMDAIVDSYFVILETVGERIEDVEEELVTDPRIETLQEIHELKRDMIILRKSVWPLREVISGMERLGSELIRKNTAIYLRDVYDHTIQVIDTIETFRDMLSGMLDIYLSSISNRMNEIMKVLTIIATIFIPLTFIAGVYGMNFDTGISPFNMPELEWYWGYPAVWFVMLFVAVLMFMYFRRKKWM